MKLTTKLMLLEIAAGFFGWAWLILTAATVYATVAAIWFSGSWFDPSAALGGLIVSKWLASGLHDNKLRVAYEAKLVSEGMTPQEAGKAWVQAYVGQTGHVGLSQEGSDQRVINEYTDYLISQPIGAEIRDLKCLPAPKETTLLALISEYKRSNDKVRMEQIKSIAVTLASFQPNVGEVPLTPLGIELGFLDPAKADLDDLAAKISNEQSAGARLGYVDLNTKVNAEVEDILSRLND